MASGTRELRSMRLPEHFHALGTVAGPSRTPAFGLREHLATLFRHKGKILAVFLATVMMAGAGAYLASKVYIATSRILVQIDREPLRLGSITGPAQIAVELRAREQVLTEVEILKSPLLAQQLAKDLGPEAVKRNLRWRWDWVRELPERARTRAKELVLRWEPTRTMLAYIGIEEEKAEPNGDQSVIVAGLIQDHVEVDPILQTDVLEVRFSAPDPNFAALALNRLVELYLEHHLMLRQRPTAREIIEEETNRMRGRLGAAESRLEEFKQKWRIVSIEDQKSMLLSRLSEAEAELYEARKQLHESEERIAETKNQLAEQSDAVPLSSVMIRDPVADELRAKLVELELERDRYVPGSPAAREVRKKIADIQARLAQTEESVKGSRTSGVNQTYQELKKTLALEHANRRALESRVKLSEQQVQEYTESLRQLDEKQVELRNLSRDVEVIEGAFLRLLEKQEEGRINETLNHRRVSNVLPIEPAMPPVVPAKPRKKLLLLLGIVVGLAGGVGMAYVSEFVRRTVSTREEAEETFGMPVLAALWRSKGDSTSRNENTAEFRLLGQFVGNIRRQNGSNNLLVTSTWPSEGKTFVTSKLATALGKAGWRVLVIDGNDLSETPSAEEENSGSKTHSTDAAVPVPTPNVRWLAPSETTEQDPSDEAIRDGVLSLVERFKSDYDIVLVDGASIATHPEQLVLASGMGATLFVVEAEKTSAAAARHSLQSIEQVEGSVIGVVLNRRRRTIPGWVYNRVLSARRASLNA